MIGAMPGIRVTVRVRVVGAVLRVGLRLGL